MNRVAATLHLLVANRWQGVIGRNGMLPAKSNACLQRKEMTVATPTASKRPRGRACRAALATALAALVAAAVGCASVRLPTPRMPQPPSMPSSPSRSQLPMPQPPMPSPPSQSRNQLPATADAIVAERHAFAAIASHAAAKQADAPVVHIVFKSQFRAIAQPANAPIEHRGGQPVARRNRRTQPEHA